MAKLQPISISGTVGNVCVYEVDGKLYMRSKSSLTRKRVLKSKAFERTRRYANDMGKAARLGSAIYWDLPVEKRNRAVYQSITGMAASLLYKGVSEEEVQNMLKKKYVDNKS
ncbi:MAG TPA: hypothetical protein VFH08_19430 [Chitinophagaceae bacterium]|nr:hypothetical protein [Chitinophagaceae bacterium]